MALISTQPADIGPGEVSYFRVAKITKYADPVPNHPGAKGRIVVDLEGFDSEEARRSGVSPRTLRSVQIVYGADCADRAVTRELPKEALAVYKQGKDGRPVLVGHQKQPEAPEVLTIKKDQPLDSDVYAALKTLADFADAEDA